MDAAVETKSLRVALIGVPNCGKTALFNRVTGSRQKVANYPGVTVERREGERVGDDGRVLRVLDLPGTYSLNPTTLDEAITRDVLLGRLAGVPAPELVVCVVDAVHLPIGLRLALEVKRFGLPMVLALNRMDVAKRRGVGIRIEQLSAALGVPVVPTVAVRRGGADALIEILDPARWPAHTAVADLLVEGVIGGAGTVLVFLPQIIILFFFILALEDSGYLPRAAYLLDRMMGFVGLSGRAFIPLLSSHACAIPGIMATRTIPNWRDRLTTIMIAPLMTCSARLPVYLLLIGALIPAHKIGPFNLQGLVMFVLYAAGILSGVLVAFVIKQFSGARQYSPLMLELPDYQWPHAGNL